MSVIDTRYGSFSIIETDNVISRSLKLYGEWAQDEIELLTCFIQLGSIVVDAGAFIGTHTRAFSEIVGSDGRVIAFEPRKAIENILTENSKLASYDNIQVVKSALGSNKKTAFVQVKNIDTDDNYGAFTLAKLKKTSDSEENITFTTLDDYTFDRLDFLKIDVEGMEFDVLKGAKETVERCRPVIFTECNSLEESSPIIKWCQNETYQIYGVINSAYNEHNFTGNIENIFGSSKETGMLLIPEEIYSRYEEVLFKQQLPRIKTADDLALLLLHKPQYPDEVFAYSSAVQNLSLMYPSPLADMHNQVVFEQDKQISDLNEAVTERDDKIREYHLAEFDRDSQIAALSQAKCKLEGEINQILNSTPWRLTAPLRLFKHYFFKQ